MASYPDGTIFDSAQTFPPKTDFGAGCVFPSGSSFQNPCTFGAGCVFATNCQLLKVDPKNPPHETGEGCVFAESCTILYTIIGAANIIGNPAAFEPVSQGSGTKVGGSGTAWPTKAITADQCSTTCGQVVSGDKVSKDWCDASQLKGFDASGATVTHPAICE